jgi:uncharacterized protein
MKGNELHNIGFPVFISYDTWNSVNKLIYYKEGKLHREDGPSRTIYHEYGNKKCETYYYKGQKHNKLEPSKIL